MREENNQPIWDGTMTGETGPQSEIDKRMKAWFKGTKKAKRKPNVWARRKPVWKRVWDFIRYV